eukprot:TRINITY_DN30247_c0_g1_i1.p1 TRINITY_DN30247_c0_g1~~TRINITY_DN30247_c0_g1_i1.p1  ORF type:complete len:877 (+),score=133.71 TRINITY_DN30247_c0_g1_i1:271-2901(+)
MSTDPHVLAALALKIKQEMRYFEIVTIVSGDTRRKCVFCIGKHAMYFMRQDLNSLIHEGGEVNYSHVLKAIRDKATSRHLVLKLHANAPPKWKSDRIFIQTDCREMLLQHLMCNWATDYMWRLGRVMPLPVYKADVTIENAQNDEPLVAPFWGFRWVTFNGYKMMVRDAFEDQATITQRDQTGEYVDPQTGTTVVMHVHEPLTFTQMSSAHGHGRDRIRWVASEYKEQILKGSSEYYILRNAPWQKSMNLIGDIASWYGWELVVRTKEATLICFLLRREYVPPMCCSIQDIAVIVRQPANHPGGSAAFPDTMRMAELCANSVCSDMPFVGIYHDFIQAKLDGLYFDEEGYDWMSSRLKLRPKDLHEKVKRLVRGLIKVLHRNKAMPKAEELLGKRGVDVIVNAEKDETWQNLDDVKDDDFETFIEETMVKQDDTVKQGQDLQKPMWMMRVARYIVWAVDGGLLGNKFTCDILLEAMPGLDDTVKKVEYVVNFMLHLRHKELDKSWTCAGIMQLMKETKLSQMYMSERVLYSFLSTETLRKSIGRGRDVEYFTCLASLLNSCGSISMKGYICRMFMELKAGAQKSENMDTSLAVTRPLVGALEERGPGATYLATFVLAALVNLCSEQELVKKVLMSSGVSQSIVDWMKTKDDDVVLYALMLAASLTKECHYRLVFCEKGLPAVLYDTLTSSYTHIRHGDTDGTNTAKSTDLAVGAVKEGILTQVCIVIGHLCNDDISRKTFTSEAYEHTVNCILYIFEKCTTYSAVQAKAMFALRQIIANRGDLKDNVGGLVISDLLENIDEMEIRDSSDREYVAQAVSFLHVLAARQMNCEIMMKRDFERVAESLLRKKKLDKLHPRIQSLRGIVLDKAPFQMSLA